MLVLTNKGMRLEIDDEGHLKFRLRFEIINNNKFELL
jgi:hypothetical protein